MPWYEEQVCRWALLPYPPTPATRFAVDTYALACLPTLTEVGMSCAMCAAAVRAAAPPVRGRALPLQLGVRHVPGRLISGRGFRGPSHNLFEGKAVWLITTMHVKGVQGSVWGGRGGGVLEGGVEEWNCHGLLVSGVTLGPRHVCVLRHDCPYHLDKKGCKS